MSSGSIWNALLEALHSSLIDELSGRFPREKIILGLPLRKQGFDLPVPEVSSFMCADVEFMASGGRGIALLAIDPGLGNGGGLGAQPEESLWADVVKRASPDFTRRGISPTFGTPEVLAKLPPNVKPRVVIWIPLELGRGRIFLGLGV